MSTENDHPAPAEAPARSPLDSAALRTSLIHPGSLWRDITVLEATGSTNADLVARAAAGAEEGTVLAAEEQRQGRGRMGRRWVSPPRASLMVSVLLRPAAVPSQDATPEDATPEDTTPEDTTPEDTTPEDATPEDATRAGVPPARRGWLPLLTGVAAATAVRRVTGVPAVLKWPNDLLVGDRKLAGILAEQSGDAIVVGTGLNVSITGDELPDTSPGALPATSLLLEHATTLDRTALLTALLEQLAHWYRAWRHASPPGDPDQSGLRQAYLDLCATIGRDVRVERPAGHVTAGRATGLDPDGRLIVAGPDGDEAVSAGDVRHLR